MLTTRRRAAATLAAWAALTLAAVWLILSGPADRLPDELAVHWNGATADRSAAAGAFAMQIGVLGLIGAALAGAAAWTSDLQRRATRRALGAGVGMWSGIVVGVVAGVVAANLDHTDWREVRLDGGGLALLIVFTGALPLLTALLGAALAGNRPDDPRESATTAPALDVPDGTRVAWSGRQGAGWTFLIMSAAALAIVVAVVVSNDEAAAVSLFGALAAVVVAGLILGGFAVSIGTKGVRVRFGVLGLPLWQIPLSDIESAEVDQRSPMEVGGWGLRIVPGKATALMTRKGECLILHRVGKRDAIFSVDDADTAAAVVNTLLRRSSASR